MYSKWHMHWYDSNLWTYHKEITNYDWKMYMKEKIRFKKIGKVTVTENFQNNYDQLRSSYRFFKKYFCDILQGDKYVFSYVYTIIFLPFILQGRIHYACVHVYQYVNDLGLYRTTSGSFNISVCIQKKYILMRLQCDKTSAGVRCWICD